MHTHLPAEGGAGCDPVPPPSATGPVAILRWPAQADLRAALVGADAPRLLVLDSDVAPPLIWDDLEDWVRATAAPAEVEARTQRLGARHTLPVAVPLMPLPLLDGDGLLQAADGREVRLDPVDTRLVHLLLERFDHVVRRTELQAVGWPTRRVTDRAVDGRVSRLRRRVGAVGLQITTIRSFGYLLERTRSD